MTKSEKCPGELSLYESKLSLHFADFIKDGTSHLCLGTPKVYWNFLEGGNKNELDRLNKSSN